MPRLKYPVLFLCLCLSFILFDQRGPATAQGQIQVTAADPPAAEQGTINLNVRITGKGFKNGARARFYVTGTTDPGGVTVNSTAFVSSTELVANITISDAATIANFDIQVQNSDGRTGKGTELFRVAAKGGGQISCGEDVTNLSISIFKYTDATNTTTYNLQPDLTSADGSPVPYVSGRTKGDTIDGRFQISNCSYDIHLNLSNSKRYFTWKFPAGSVVGTSINTGGFNIDRVGTVPITDGSTDFWNWCNTADDNYGGCGFDEGGYFVRRTFGSAIFPGSQKHYGLRFNYSTIDNIHTTAAGTAYVKVYHLDADTWTIIPDQVLPPAGVTDPNATAGEWSVLLDMSTTPGTVVSYQKMPFKIVVTRF